jgi:hypothetical protein
LMGRELRGRGCPPPLLRGIHKGESLVGERELRERGASPFLF